MDEEKKYRNNDANLKRASEGDEDAVESLIRDNYTLVVSIARR